MSPGVRLAFALALLLAPGVGHAMPMAPSAPDWSWLFDDGAGSTLSAYTGGEDGNLQGDATWDADSPFASGFSLRFDGNDAVDVPGLSTALVGHSAFTLSAWIRADATGVDAGFWSAQQLSGAGNTRTQDLFGARYDASGWLSSQQGQSTSDLFKLGVTLDQSGSVASFQYESAEGVQTTDWQHVAIVWETGVGLRLYVDGVLDTPTQDETAGESGTLAGQVSFTIGDGTKTGWRGRTDEFAVWTRALGQNEIDWLSANSLASGVPVPEPTSAAMLLLGLLGLAHAGRRRLPGSRRAIRGSGARRSS